MVEFENGNKDKNSNNIFHMPIKIMDKKEMWQQIKFLFVKLFNRKKYVISYDSAIGNDFNCKVEGYIDKNGKFHIIKVDYFK
jgi:hypothetical protein